MCTLRFALFASIAWLRRRPIPLDTIECLFCWGANANVALFIFFLFQLFAVEILVTMSFTCLFMWKLIVETRINDLHFYITVTLAIFVFPFF